MRNQYFYHCPRGFSNEYTVYVAATKAIVEAILAKYPNIEKITRGEALKYGYSVPLDAKKNGSSDWYGGFCDGPHPYMTRNDAIDIAILNTEYQIKNYPERN